MKYSGLAEITLVAAVNASDYGLGKNGKLLRTSAIDMQWFKNVTSGTVCIVGRKTLDEILDKTAGKGLPNRQLVCVSSGLHTNTDNITYVPNPTEALFRAKNFLCPISVIGGASIYTAFSHISDRIVLTRFYESLEADTFFCHDILTRFKLSSEIRPVEDNITISTYYRK